MQDNRNNEQRGSNQGNDVSQRTGSNEHNDYRVNAEPLPDSDRQEREGTTKKDTDESYMDYNGNSESNDPNRSR